MTTLYEVVFSRGARSDLFSMYRHIAKAGAPKAAGSFIVNIEEFCRSLGQFPERGIVRPGMRPGTRLAFYRRQLTVAYLIDEERKRVVIMQIWGRGQDFEASLGIKGKNT